MIEYKPKYVLGFYFMANRHSLALIRKNKPEFQAGKLNGVGGRIEPGEQPTDAMIREFSEETGKLVTLWRQFAVLEFPDAVVYCFDSRGDWLGLKLGNNSPTDETVNIFFVDWIIQESPSVIMPNLRWLIPLALSGETSILTIRFDTLS